jgi:hypothetical protein
MSSVSLPHNQVKTAGTSVHRVSAPRHPDSLDAAVSAPAPRPPPIDQNTVSLPGAVDLTREVAAEIQDDMNQASPRMLNLTSSGATSGATSGTTYCQGVAAKVNNPDLRFDTATREQILLHHPLPGPLAFQDTGYSETIRGAELSSKFPQQVPGFAIAMNFARHVPAFVASFGRKTSAGLDTSSTPLHVASNTICIDPRQVGNQLIGPAASEDVFVRFQVAGHAPGRVPRAPSWQR